MPPPQIFGPAKTHHQFMIFAAFWGELATTAIVFAAFCGTLAIIFCCRTQIFFFGGGGIPPAPFSVRLKIIVPKWGGQWPRFSPQNIFLVSSWAHHVPAHIYGFSGGKKHQVLFPPTTEQTLHLLICSVNLAFQHI